MRIALISDLHGNLVALRAVLADAESYGVDEVLCLGDVATLGPKPNEVVATLKDLGLRCVLGNHDEFMLDAELIHTYSEVPIVVDSVDWCRDQLTREHHEFLRGFRTGVDVDLGHGNQAFFFHGSPRCHMEDILATMSAEEIDDCLQGAEATVLAGGHTHVQMVRQHRGMLLVNPGSAGMPFREYVNGCAPSILPWAEYAIVESSAAGVGVQLRRVAVDKEDLRREAAASPSPICRALELAYS